MRITRQCFRAVTVVALLFTLSVGASGGFVLTMNSPMANTPYSINALISYNGSATWNPLAIPADPTPTAIEVLLRYNNAATGTVTCEVDPIVQAKK